VAGELRFALGPTMKEISRFCRFPFPTSPRMSMLYERVVFLPGTVRSEEAVSEMRCLILVSGPAFSECRRLHLSFPPSFVAL